MRRKLQERLSDCGSLNSLVRSGVVHSFTCTREEHMYCTVV
jgi:hypothetical protein